MTVAKQPRNKAEFRITLSLPWLLRLPDLTFEGKHGRNQYRLFTKAVLDRDGDEEERDPRVAFRAMTGEITEAKGAHLPGAMLRYTEVSIGFFKRIRGTAVCKEDFDAVITIAHGCLNHCLDVYRYMTKDTEVRPLSNSEFHQVRAGRGLLLQSKVETGSRGKLTSGVFFNEADPISLGKHTAVDEETVLELRAHLKAGHTPALSPLLLLNAQTYLRTGQTRLAVVDMSAALDILVEQKARAFLIHSDGDPDDVSERLERKTSGAIMHEILLPNMEIPPEADFPLDDWLGKHRHLRNRVVHDGHEPTAQEAKECFENVSRLCGFLSSLEIQTLKD